MDDLLILCSIDSVGEALWTRSAELFAADHAVRKEQRLLLELPTRSLFPESAPASAAQEQARLVGLIRGKLPTRNISSLQVALAISVLEEVSIPRLDAMLGAFEGISQIPAQVHVFMIGPDQAVKTMDGVMRVSDAIRVVQGKKLHCRDICWLRIAEAEAGGTGGPVPVSRLRAAHHGLWSLLHSEARRPFSILQTLQQPHRDSFSVSLLFNRPLWQQFATADITIRLTEFLLKPPRPEALTSATQWVETQLQPLLVRLISATPASNVALQRSTATLESNPVAVFRSQLKALQEQGQRIRGLKREIHAEEVGGLIQTSLPGILDRTAQLAENELAALIYVVYWSESVHSQIIPTREQADALRITALRPWIEATNRLLRETSGLGALSEFNLAQPESWAKDLAILRQELVPYLTVGDDTPLSLTHCVAGWINRVLPALFHGETGLQTIETAVLESMTTVLASLEQRLEKAQGAHMKARQEIEAGYPPPSGLWARVADELVFKSRRKRALADCDNAAIGPVESIYQEAERVLLAGQRWLWLAGYSDNLAQLCQFAAEKVAQITGPALRTHGQLLSARKRAERTLAAVAQGPKETSSTLEFLSRSEMAALVASIEADTRGWIQQASIALTPANATWQEVAQRCADTIEVWSDLRVASFPLNLQVLMEVRFPGLAPSRLARLLALGQAEVLPLQHERATTRRICQEWQLPFQPNDQTNAALSNCIMVDEVVSTAKTTVIQLSLDDQDRLDLHLHVLGFAPNDYVYWRLLKADAFAPSLKIEESGNL